MPLKTFRNSDRAAVQLRVRGAAMIGHSGSLDGDGHARTDHPYSNRTIQVNHRASLCRPSHQRGSRHRDDRSC
jgi:hypothetical protein